MFCRKLSRAQVEYIIDQTERLLNLQYILPAMIRFFMLTKKAPRSLIGPGGQYHDRCFELSLKLARFIDFQPQEIIQIAPAWDALPNVLHASVNFANDTLSPNPEFLIRLLEDRTKEFLVISSANPYVREKDPERQMRLFFELVDHPDWSLVLFIFSGSLVIRTSIIREHPSCLNPERFHDLFLRLCSAATCEGIIKVYR